LPGNVVADISDKSTNFPNKLRVVTEILPPCREHEIAHGKCRISSNNVLRHVVDHYLTHQEGQPE
jgi:hypothetical protein